MTLRRAAGAGRARADRDAGGLLSAQGRPPAPSLGCDRALHQIRAAGDPKEATVPLYMDEHDLPGVKAEDVAGAHEADMRVQGKYGVDYKHYWVDEAGGKVFCLVEAPDKESANKVHEEAHGLVAHRLYEVQQGA